jgi:hypothetical protein
MVTITSENDDLVIRVLGLHQLWAFKKEIRFKRSNLISVYQNIEEIKWVKGIRFPGTHLPFVIVAGTYFPFGSGKEFWDVCNKNNALILNLQNEYYQRIIVEVENPKQMIEMIINA